MTAPASTLPTIAESGTATPRGRILFFLGLAVPIFVIIGIYAYAALTLNFNARKPSLYLIPGTMLEKELQVWYGVAGAPALRLEHGYWHVEGFGPDGILRTSTPFEEGSALDRFAVVAPNGSIMAHNVIRDAFVVTNGADQSVASKVQQIQWIRLSTADHGKELLLDIAYRLKVDPTASHAGTDAPANSSSTIRP